ncbi:AraC family transcriptional regulator [Paenibacillus sp. ATY16]|uniref:AraC family transcriptional regulator n=1 Tax=Paenibacillus sp. ATY16 TaxID=1759312 RepID=UPI00200E41EA|nr:AraC family transcriptional regulator [Paenibacillus sp. ATY16]MCK9859580.1 AraC family transcriptional regulator [Paenibacillus sp. ATY16]
MVTNDTKKAGKAPAHHSSIEEHFHHPFPVFINRWEEGFDLREHDHAYLEIVYVMSGEGYHYVADEVNKTSKGSLYIIPIGTSHIFRPNGTSNRLLVYNLCIRPDWIGELNAWLSPYCRDTDVLHVLDGTPGTYLFLRDTSLELAPSFEQLHREFTEESWGFETTILAGLLQLLTRISRKLKMQDTTGNQTIHGTRHSELLNILDHINRHIAEPLKVEQLAVQAGISQRHFIRLFRQQTGMGFSEYVQNKRVELACQLLTGTSQPLADIAKQVGYQDPAHFREVFRKIMGMTPRQYRPKTSH